MTRKLKRLVDRSRQIFIVAHVDPDGDTIGSALGLARALRKMGKDCTLACADSVPDALLFLPGVEEFGIPRLTDEDLIIAVDVSHPNRLGQAYCHLPSLDTPMVNIDHHFTNSMFGTINLVRTEATATAEIIFDLLQEWEVLLDSVLATHLLTGIVTDTQSFSTSATTPRILEVSSQLMKAGASLTEIHENYYKKREVETLRLWGRILAEMQLDDQLVWSVNTLDMRSRSHAAPDDGDGIVNLLATARQAKAAIMFTENEDGKIGISIRSRPGVDISPIAIHFGGGGHPQAAGTELLGDLCEVIPKVLIKAKDVVNAHDPK